MSVSVLANPGTWQSHQRRMGSLVVLGVVVAAVLGGLATYFLAPESAGLVSWILVGVVALALVFLVLLMVLGARAASPGAAAEPHAHEAHAGHAHTAAESAYAPPTPAPAPPAPQTLTLRCGDCSTVFDVTDTGARPLYHTCPGCGAEGALRDVPAAAPAPAWQAPPSAAPPAASAPAPAKRLRLRCGGCKEIFAIDDSGERPLRRPCPHCGRTGEIR